MEKNLEDELKFCSFSCKYSNSKKSMHAGCYAENAVYCKKYDLIREKGLLCLDNKKYQRLSKHKK